MKNKSVILLIVFIAVIVATLGVRAMNAKNDSIIQESAQNANGFLTEPVNVDGIDYLVNPKQIVQSGLVAEDLPALTSAMFTTPFFADSFLADDVEGISVSVNNEVRYYSYHILNWHIAVNDTVNEQPILVSQCTFCKSAGVYSRVVDGQTLTFSVTGDVYNNNLLLKDAETGSLWLQVTGEAIAGELVGKKLDRIPFEVQSWKTWMDSYPEGLVMSFPTGTGFEYARHPLANYDSSETIYFPLKNRDRRVELKAPVNFFEQGSETLAFVKSVLAVSIVQNDTVSGEAIVGIYDTKNATIRVFSRMIENQSEPLTLVYDAAKKEIRDEQTNSLWNANGLAIEGELKGTQLARKVSGETSWMCISSLRQNIRSAGEQVLEIDDSGVIEIDLN